MTIIGKEITPKLLRKILGFSVLGLLVVGVLVYFGLIWREKAQFAQAEKEIDALYAQIVEKVGKPDQEKKEQSCGYASRVYGKGPRGCSVAKYALYENKNINQANEITRTIAQSIGIRPTRYATTRYGAGEYKYDFAKEDERTIDQSLSSSLNINFSKGCSIELVHPVVGSTYTDMFNVTSKENFLIGIVCGGSALAE
ncbi:hypothetical protein HY004_02050 [Candidatus Saccharibacteria bacterium]|nr:hypothetical protein [Candidatus Saccharibacteria bacterium]